MFDLNKPGWDAKVDHEKTFIQWEIEATDMAIDKLMYELYDLKEEETELSKWYKTSIL